MLKSMLFIGNAMLKARQFQREFIANGGSGFSDQALYQVGMIIHTLTDSTSPSHAGFQVWHGLDGIGNRIRAVGHIRKEWQISQKQMVEAVHAAQVPFALVFGDALARQAFTRPR
jgi:hypothetical protein